VTSLPEFDLAKAAPTAVVAALADVGCVLVQEPTLDRQRGEALLAMASAVFAMSAAAKDACAIARSPHFRGHSAMHNERDWREQMHFGREVPALQAGPGAPPFERLQGPNLWPEVAGCRERVLDWMERVDAMAGRILSAVALGLGRPAVEVHEAGAGYLLLKLIHYHAQPEAVVRRRGVAAHLDFSLVTVTLQDGTGGLEVQRRDGVWCPVPPRPGVLLVHVGELLAYVTRGTFAATPHRVVNPSVSRARQSVPVFVNPPLHAVVEPWPVPAQPPPSATEHVHHVLDADCPPPPFGFGEAEWRRKGQNGWCRVCAPVAR
jgi:isopenicillin N synthase-like dioxygenase